VIDVVKWLELIEPNPEAGFVDIPVLGDFDRKPLSSGRGRSTLPSPA
jgi:hypothetical protein